MNKENKKEIKTEQNEMPTHINALNNIVFSACQEYIRQQLQSS